VCGYVFFYSVAKFYRKKINLKDEKNKYFDPAVLNEKFCEKKLQILSCKKSDFLFM